MERALTNVDCCYLEVCRRALAAGYIISYQLFNMATLLCSSFKEHTHTVILFHELGSNGNTFCSASTYVEAGQRNLNEIYILPSNGYLQMQSMEN